MSNTAPRSLSMYEAATLLLREAGHPMTAADLTRLALDRALIETHGKTPVESMASALYSRAKDDEGSPIVKVALPGLVRSRRGSVKWGLREWTAAHSARRRQPG